MRYLKGRDVDLSSPLPLQDILMPIAQPQPLLLPPPPPPICQSQCTYSSLEIPHRLPNPQHLYPLPPRLRNRSRVRSQVFDASESPPPYNVDEERRLLFSPSSPAEPSSAEHHHHYGASESPLSLSDGLTTTLVPSSTSEQEDMELGGMPGDSEFMLVLQSPGPFWGIKCHRYHHYCPSEFGCEEWLVSEVVAEY